MIKAFLFDIGNVLVRFDHTRALERILKQSSSSPEAIWKGVEPLIGPLETGTLSSAEFLDQAISAAGFTGDVDAFASHYCDIFTANDPMWDLVEKLKATHPLYLFSNTSELHLAHLNQEFPQFSVFTDGIYSMRVRAMKPQPEIYDAAVKLMGVKPEEVFYIDDLAPNIEKGMSVGFRSHMYDWRDHEALLKQIEAS